MHTFEPNINKVLIKKISPMKKFLSTVLFLMIVTATFAAGFEGNWLTKVKGPDGNEMELAFTFKMDEGKLIGSIKTPNGDTPLSNVKVDDKSITFEITFGEMTMKNTGTLTDDDTIIVKNVDSPMGNLEMILKRQK